MTLTMSTHAKDNAHHVHFGEEADEFGKDNEIVIQQLADHKLSAHLGFLKFHHHYEILLRIPLSLWDIAKNSVLKQYKNEKFSSKHCSFNDVMYTENYANVRVNFHAYKEKLLKEDIYLGTSDHGPIMCITLNARVLGKGKGTPLLRNGIHSLGPDYYCYSDSDDSDWQGFEQLNVD